MTLIIFILIFINSFLHAQHENTDHSESLIMSSIDDKHVDKHALNMLGMYGDYPMNRDLEGTSWQPDATPLLAIHKQVGKWSLMIDTILNLVVDRQGGPRGGKKFFSTSMAGLMIHRNFKKAGKLGFHFMISLDALMGPRGYPLLLQTGETANGKTPLIDRQHPHDLILELATMYSVPITQKSYFFIYFGLPGEPALGPPVYFMRYSGTYNPEAPIGHHWQDSTHFVYGVLTTGFVVHDVKLEWSVFTGREPDQHRFNFDKPRFDSFSGRISYNPIEQLSLQLSAAHIKSPEQLEPCVNVDRIVASIAYHQPFNNNKIQWSNMFIWGRNFKRPGCATDAFLLESTVNLYNMHIFFARFERVDKDKLFKENNPLFGKIFTVNKFTAGYIFEFVNLNCIQFGAGFLGSVPILPKQLQHVYGKHPFSFMVFLQMRLI